jgi:two-component system sensor histidine kinase/response regulator
MQRQSRVRFEIRDTGIGLKDEQIGRLFSAFTQADSSTTRRYGGTGLGLVISSRLVRLMGGRLDVTSEPGKGSCFCFELELPRPEHTAPGMRQPVPQVRNALVAANDRISTAIITDILEQMNIAHRTAYSADEALNLIDADSNLPTA